MCINDEKLRKIFENKFADEIFFLARASRIILCYYFAEGAGLRAGRQTNDLDRELSLVHFPIPKEILV